MPTALEIAKRLGISEEEALQVIADDKAIDKGEKLFELTQEQKQAVKKLKNSGTRKPTVYKHDTRPRKADQEKQEIVNLVAVALENACGEITLTNPERQIDFEYKGRKMRLVLSVPRK